MCNREYHFDDNKKQSAEALGHVARHQYGVIVGAGLSMPLPQVKNAVGVTQVPQR